MPEFSRLSNEELDQKPPPSLPDKISVISSSARMCQSVLADLRSLEAMPLPSTASLVPLCAMHSRLARATAISDSQARTVDDLIVRSAVAVAKWHQMSIQRDGEAWSARERRLAAVEQCIRREEATRRQRREGF